MVPLFRFAVIESLKSGSLLCGAITTGIGRVEYPWNSLRASPLADRNQLLHLRRT